VCETYYVTLKEEHILRVFENRVLKRILVPKRDEVTGGWRNLHYKKFHNFYSSQDIVRIINQGELDERGM
jgi:hypothetical protein